MKTEEYIGSCILEQYVLGYTTFLESQEVELRAASDDQVRLEIEAITAALGAYALGHAKTPNPIIKPFLLATIDYSERMKNGEPVSEPPLLTENSAINDYAKWLDRSDMVPWDNQDIYAKIIGYNSQALTAIVWLKNYAPQEVHDHELEKFLIIEGTCDVIVGDEVNALVPGDYFTIPLHKKHMIKVTSTVPCKVILQRVAA